MNDLVVSSDRTFSRALFGLNKAEVYSYLNQISSAYEELQLQTQILREQNDKLSDSNRDNALKIYNMQEDIKEAQRKTDKANVELQAAKKQIDALKQELADAKKETAAAEKRIKTLTDELIKAGGSGNSDSTDSEEDTSSKESAFSFDSTVDDASDKKKEDNVVFADEPKTESKAEEPKKGTFDIFADMRNDVAAEKAKAEAAASSFNSTVSSANNFDDDEVYAGEVDIEIDESKLIGNEDDEDEGFSFL